MRRGSTVGGLDSAMLVPVPGLLVLLVGTFVPFGMALYNSFHRMDLAVPSQYGRWIGDAAYRELLHDPAFLLAIGRTLGVALAATMVEVGLGAALALALLRLPPGPRKVCGHLLLLPVLTAPVLVGLMWYFLLHPQFGAVSWLLHLQAPLLARPASALATIVFVDVWQWTPFVTFLAMAALSAIPAALRDAARLDGLTGGWYVLAVELPHLKGVLAVVGILRLLEAFKIYDTVLILTNGGPGNTTTSISLWMSRTMFQKTRFGYASAATMVVDYLVLVAAVILFTLIVRRWDAARGTS